MVLGYLGQRIDEAELARRLGTTPWGTPGQRLLHLARPALRVFFGPLTLPPLPTEAASAGSSW